MATGRPMSGWIVPPPGLPTKREADLRREREAKIAELRKRIAEGSYHVDSKAVADRMVDDHMKMADIG